MIFSMFISLANYSLSVFSKAVLHLERVLRFPNILSIRITKAEQTCVSHFSLRKGRNPLKRGYTVMMDVDYFINSLNSRRLHAILSKIKLMMMSGNQFPLEMPSLVLVSTKQQLRQRHLCHKEQSQLLHLFHNPQAKLP